MPYPLINPTLKTIGMAAAVSGLLAVYIVAVGIYPAFAARQILPPSLTLGYLMLAGVWFYTGWTYARSGSWLNGGIGAGTTGVVSGAVYVSVLELAKTENIQGIFVSLSAPTINSAFFGLSGVTAFIVIPLCTGVLSLAGFLIANTPSRVRSCFLSAFVGILLAALLRDLWTALFSNLTGTRRWASWIYAAGGLTWIGAAVAALAGVAFQFARSRRMDNGGRGGDIGAVVVFVLIAIVIPYFTNAFVAQVMLLVGLYALMGMGLNLELGLAGLLDLGFVAFFAIGAYAMALLSADAPIAIARLTFWEALPIATICAALGGFVFGLPVLRVRGDYLALATLGLGEIVRILVVSDFMASTLGGAQGIVAVPRPSLGDTPMTSQLSMYYLTLALSALVAIAGYRLRHSPIGRAWMAARDDEDAAATLGVDLVKSKLKAYVLGAAFAGIAGALFASTLGSVFPQSFKLDVSINVLALLVIGGLGSLPGVFVGSLILIGMPEFLREFGEFRYLFYGVLLILVMRLRPSGLWPSSLKARGEI